MTSPFFGLDIATRALQTQQTLVDITNNNIANANTPGYSRQSGNVQATAAYPIPVFNNSGTPGQLGTGVSVTTVTRARDTFADLQIRQQYAQQGRWNTRQTALAQVEATVNEPSTTGLSSQLTAYWNSWQQLANNPSDPSVRVAVVQQGQSLAQAFNTQAQQLTQAQQSLDAQVGQTVTSINDYANQIANLNTQIAQVQNGGMQANDLMDQRDELLDKLSSLANISTTQSSDGQESVYVNGHQLVAGNQVSQMVANVSPGLPTTVSWSDGSSVNLSTAGGQLQGLYEARNTDVGGQLAQLNQLASRVIQSVNSVHESGVGLDGKGGQPFFDGTDAATIKVDSALTGTNGTDHLAAAQMTPDSTSSTGYSFATGDSSNAVAIASLANTVGQLASSSTVQSGTTYAGPPSTTVTGVDVSQATPNSTLNITVSGNTVNINGVAATVTEGSDANGNELVTVAGQGARITLSANVAANSAGALSSVLGNLNNQTVATQPSPNTIGAQYSQQVAALGVASSTASNEATNQQVLVTQLDSQRQAVSGVSIDEEATNLIQYQRAYEAAARVVSVVDSMLNTLINNTGVQ